ncbi:ABC transporter permease [Micromonospora sp. 4G57]|jgi:NitT/TauT family transport system permease protein|uniref:ABC transporter permease n=1 Tax=Micromonospora sicca TaxID=2202420 RepID=A0ABU5J8K0_9ACTN|nr:MULTISPECIES: ABC transporter permease [unclassified Micromonospora]MDZ5443655.1 ABC transporter permease [Micromonospora sp. 4G57]MDZ5488873.1 ABC transporter permease [Micromonospora sp. 4G53]
MAAQSTIEHRERPASPSGPTSTARRPAGAGTAVARFVRKTWRPAAVLVAIFVVWWAVTAANLVKPYLVPSPGRTLDVVLAQSGYFAHHTWITSYETVLGFAIAIAVGVLSAVVMVYSPTIEKSLYPLLLFAQVIPKIAIAPLFIVWLGFGLTPKIVVAVLMAFFPIVISTVTGLKSIDPEMLQLSATMGAGPAQTFRKIRFPAALPHLFAGLKVAATMAVTGAVVGEFVGANEGLGYVILQANGNLDTPMLFAGLLIMSLLGVVLFVVVELLEYFVLPWHASRRTDAVTTSL